MLKTNDILFILFLTITLTPIFAQTNKEFKKENFSKSKAKDFKHALRSLDKGYYYYEQGPGSHRLALKHMLDANDFNPNNALLNYRIGKAYLNTAPKSKSITYLLKAYDLKSRIADDIIYSVAYAYQLNLEFDKAIKEYENFGNMLPSGNEAMWDNEVSMRIKECERAKKMIENPVDIVTENLGGAINSPYQDYRPLITADDSMIFFTSRRENVTGGKKDPDDHQYYEDIFVSYRKGDAWSVPTRMSGTLNSSSHDAVLGISPDGQNLLLYRGKTNGGDLYVSEARGSEWSNPKKLPKTINTEFHESSACFSYDGNTLYFVSDRIDKTEGGLDIYKSHKDSSGEWLEAINIGASINTEFDEESVFIHPSGNTLYFSSKGHNTMGGFDIYKSELNSYKEWSEPVNMGYPINTPDDDLFFIMSFNGKHGYYSSEKTTGYGLSDIYKITILEEEKDTLEDKKLNVSLIIKDIATKEPVDTKVDVEVVDVKSNKIYLSVSFDDGKNVNISFPANEKNEYVMFIIAEDYLFHSEKINIDPEKEQEDIKLNVELGKIKTGSSIVLKNIFFDYGKATLTARSINELDRVVGLLKEHPNLKIEISGHTDNVSSYKFNINLSKNRAKAVVAYLISHGIDKNRLKYKGFAFSRPIATNDTDEGRQLNRRVEFKILSE